MQLLECYSWKEIFDILGYSEKIFLHKSECSDLSRHSIVPSIKKHNIQYYPRFGCNFLMKVYSTIMEINWWLSSDQYLQFHQLTFRIFIYSKNRQFWSSNPKILLRKSSWQLASSSSSLENCILYNHIALEWIVLNAFAWLIL